MTAAKLHVVPGHVVDFGAVLAIALNRIESQSSQRRHAADKVEREMMKTVSVESCGRLHVVPGRVVEFSAVLAIALNRVVSRGSQRRPAADEV